MNPVPIHPVAGPIVLGVVVISLAILAGFLAWLWNTPSDVQAAREAEAMRSWVREHLKAHRYVKMGDLPSAGTFVKAADLANQLRDLADSIHEPDNDEAE